MFLKELQALNCLLSYDEQSDLLVVSIRFSEDHKVYPIAEVMLQTPYVSQCGFLNTTIYTQSSTYFRDTLSRHIFDFTHLPLAYRDHENIDSINSLIDAINQDNRERVVHPGS